MASIIKRNDKWFVRVRKQGQSSQSKTFNIKKDAQRWAVMIERELDQGHVGYVAKSVTLGDLLERYLKEVTPHKKSRDKETWRVKALLKRSISGVSLTSLTSIIISNYKTVRLVDGARTTRYDLALIRYCLEFARLEWGYYLPINPVDLVSKPRLNKPRDRRVGKDDIDTLMHALRQTKVTYLKPLILIAIETGLRQVELVKLMWSDVDLDSRLLGNIFVWELVDFLKPDSLGNLSAGKYIQLDCKLLRFKYLSFAFYKQPMGNGTPEVSKPIKQLQGWKYSPPNTTQEYVKKFICNL